MGNTIVAPIKYIYNNTKDGTWSSNSISQDFSTRTLELQLLDAKKTFWTDSRVVLGYIWNESRQFKVYK